MRVIQTSKIYNLYFDQIKLIYYRPKKNIQIKGSSGIKNLIKAAASRET